MEGGGAGRGCGLGGWKGEGVWTGRMEGKGVWTRRMDGEGWESCHRLSCCLPIVGTGATLVFDDGDTRSTIALLVLADDMPEIDETLIVSLSGATGGASIATGEEGSAMVVINANDGVAGVVGLSSLFRSAVVGEGETAVFEVVRGQSAMGLVEVDWEISGTDAALEFVNTQGTERFLEVWNSS